MVFPRPLDFIQLIRACPNLRALHLSVMLLFVDHHDIHPGTAVAPPPETMSLDTLIWRKSTLFALRWLRDHPRFSPRAMSLAWSEESAIDDAPYQQETTTAAEIVQETLRKTGPTLERLELCADDGWEHELVDYGLSHCVSLRGIKLETSYRNRSPGSRDLPRIVHAIHQLNSPALSSIEVGLGWDKFVNSHCAAELLTDLDDALAHLAQDRPGITIALLIWTWSDKLVDNIIYGLPRLRATETRFCVRMDTEGMQRARSEAEISSHPSHGYDYQWGDPQSVTLELETAPVQKQVKWYSG